ncbi:O-methyltransferase [Bacteroidota bacterium]
MSSSQTEIIGQIADYINNNFSSEDDFLKQLKKDSLEQGFPDIAISSEQGAFLQFIMKAINAKNVLEIGSLAGYSAITMARVLPDGGKLIAVEKEKKFAEFIGEKVKQAGLDYKIELVNEDAIAFLKTFNPGYPLDFIFIDAEKPEYIDYFNLSVPHLRKGGIIAADNALAFGEVANPNPKDGHHSAKDIIAIQEFNRKVKNNKDFFTILLPVGDGLLLSFKL